MAAKRKAEWPLGHGKPVKTAATLAVIYVLVSATYIYVSGHVAEALARDTQQLVTIEALKGFGFVLVTGVLLFVLTFLWSKRSQRQERLLLESERRAMAGMCSASVAHDLNNLLMALSALVEGLKTRVHEDEFLRAMREELEVGVQRLSQLSKSLVRAARELNPEEDEVVDLPARLSLNVGLLRRHPDVKNCNVTMGDAAPVSLRLNATLFDQAVMNLLVNAAQAAKEPRRVEIGARREEDAVVLEFHDNGPGVQADEAEAIFDPGYTTKANGTGLGLLWVRAFAASCGAQVSVQRSHLGGAAIVLRVPIRHDEPSSDPAGAAAKGAAPALPGLSVAR